jgi:hypothetical protein
MQVECKKEHPKSWNNCKFDAPAYALQLNSYQTQKTVEMSSLDISVPTSHDTSDSDEAAPKRIKNHGLIFAEARRAISFSTGISKLDALTELKPKENTLVVSVGAYQHAENGTKIVYLGRTGYHHHDLRDGVLYFKTTPEDRVAGLCSFSPFYFQKHLRWIVDTGVADGWIQCSLRH